MTALDWATPTAPFLALTLPSDQHPVFGSNLISCSRVCECLLVYPQPSFLFCYYSSEKINFLLQAILFIRS
uniref:Uncharacterized protein n=1 Tax=Ditylenchus dipsaci TaxID=166011 RepID=A0A915CQ10_9BILA